MKIACKVSNVCIKSNVPSFKYRFAEAHVPIEVDDKHSEKILRNGDFYESNANVQKTGNPGKKTVDKKTWREELIEINGIGEKTADDIGIVFPTRGKLLEALEKEQKLPFDDNIELKLKEVFIH